MNMAKTLVFNHSLPFESDLLDFMKELGEYSNSIPSFESCSSESCSPLKTCNENHCKYDEFCRNYLGITQEELKELQNRTTIDHLKCDGEVNYYQTTLNPMLDDDKVVDNKDTVSTLVSVNKRLEMIQVTKTSFPRSYYKYCNYQWNILSEKFTTNLEFEMVKFPAIMACVKVYHPLVLKPSCNVKLLQEIHILEDQTLAQLKDKIVCSLDYIGDKDLSDEYFLKDVGYNLKAKDEYPSSFIFIESTFYSDMRSEKHKDLSKVLRDWATEKKLGSYQVAKMESTKISDLKVRIGRPYVYQHQGNCEHILIFSDIRILDSLDPKKRGCYPKVHCTGRTYGKHCMMCTEHYARWLVVGSQRLIHERAFLCKKCFLSYNYIDGRKVGNFQAFKYIDPIAIL